MRSYDDFIASKTSMPPSVGIADPGPLPSFLKPFQRDIVNWSLKRGRGAIFAWTGLGKTPMQLAYADAVSRHCDAPMLLLAPLAVAQQTIQEATEKFGIPDISYAADRGSIKTRLTITNYDRMDKFDFDQFPGVVCDESSIIKSHESQTRGELIDACQNMHFILPCTATPAPNDYVELGNHAELLGIMTQKEMLAMFFVHDGSVRANTTGIPEKIKWRLKRHAKADFWRWMSSWAVLVRDPSDLGYDEPGYVLPPLRKHQVTVRSELKAQAGMLFPMEARTMGERQSARRDTVNIRVKAAAEIVAREPDENWLIWCGLNAEGDALARTIPGLVQVTGTDTLADKTERLLGFARGNPKRLVSKPSIAGMGLNFQICSRMIFVGLNDSFEQLFQAIRRCWRFGQLRPVDVWLIASDLEGAVVANLESKEAEFNAMAAAMAEHTRNLVSQNVRGGRIATVIRATNQPMRIPEWLIA